MGRGRRHLDHKGNYRLSPIDLGLLPAKGTSKARAATTTGKPRKGLDRIASSKAAANVRLPVEDDAVSLGPPERGEFRAPPDNLESAAALQLDEAEIGPTQWHFDLGGRHDGHVEEPVAALPPSHNSISMHRQSVRSQRHEIFQGTVVTIMSVHGTPTVVPAILGYGAANSLVTRGLIDTLGLAHCIRPAPPGTREMHAAGGYILPENFVNLCISSDEHSIPSRILSVVVHDGSHLIPSNPGAALFLAMHPPWERIRSAVDRRVVEVDESVASSGFENSSASMPAEDFHSDGFNSNERVKEGEAPLGGLPVRSENGTQMTQTAAFDPSDTSGPDLRSRATARSAIPAPPEVFTDFSRPPSSLNPMADNSRTATSSPSKKHAMSDLHMPNSSDILGAAPVSTAPNNDDDRWSKPDLGPYEDNNFLYYPAFNSYPSIPPYPPFP